MKIIKYSKKDLMPVVLSVLTLALADMVRFALNIAVNGEFKHLKGKIDRNGIDDDAIALLLSASDWRIQFMMSYVTNFIEMLNAYTDDAGLNIHEICSDTRINEHAYGFYYSLVKTDQVEAENDYTAALSTFNLSILLVFYYLCELVILGEADFDHVCTENYFQKMFSEVWKHYRDAEQEEFRFVAELNHEMVAFYLVMSSNRMQ